MTVKEMMEKLNFKLAAGEGGILKEIKGVYTCDLLSWVMAHAKKANAWVTIQTHPNVAAVASLLDLSCVIIPEYAEIDSETIDRANQEDIPLLTSSENGYEICCKLYSILKE